MGAILLLAISVSIDSLSTGMAYGMTGIRIPWQSKSMIALILAVPTFAAVTMGDYLLKRIPARCFHLLGGGVLIAMGVKTAWSVYQDRAVKDYDQDGSKVLEPWESVVIGLTMALDSMSAGIGITAGTERYAFPILAAVAGVLFLTIGNYVRVNVRFVNAFGAVLLIGLGLFRCFFS